MAFWIGNASAVDAVGGNTVRVWHCGGGHLGGAEMREDGFEHLMNEYGKKEALFKVQKRVVRCIAKRDTIMCEQLIKLSI